MTFVNLILILLCGSCAILGLNRNNHITTDTSKNPENDDIFKMYMSGFKPNQSKNLKITNDLLQNDFKIIKYVVSTTHPYSYLEDKKKISNNFMKKLENIFLNKTPIELCQAINSLKGLKNDLGISAHLNGIGGCYKKIKNNQKELSRKWNYHQLRTKNSIIGHFKTGAILDDVKFLDKLIFSINQDDGVILDFRNVKAISSLIGENIKANVYGVPVNYLRNPTAQTPLIYKNRFYTKNWVTYFNTAVLNNSSCATNSCELPHEFISKTAKKIEETKKSFKNGKTELINFDLARLNPFNDSKYTTLKKPIYILVNQNCSQYCENIVLSLKELPNVHVIGQKTSGRLQFENIAITKLPNSGVIVEVPHNYAELKSKFSDSLDGIVPEEKIFDNNDYLAIVKKIHNNQYGKSKSVNRSEKVKIVFIRPEYHGAALEIEIFVDGKEKQNYVGRTYGEQFLELYLEPGKHTIFQKAKTWIPYTINAKTGESYYFYQSVIKGIWTGDSRMSLIPYNVGEFYKKKLRVGKLK